MATKPFTFRVTEKDRHILAILAARAERSEADVLRRLLRSAARRQRISLEGSDDGG
jgi:hypothetical protein